MEGTPLEACLGARVARQYRDPPPTRHIAPARCSPLPKRHARLRHACDLLSGQHAGAPCRKDLTLLQQRRAPPPPWRGDRPRLGPGRPSRLHGPAAMQDLHEQAQAEDEVKPCRLRRHAVVHPHPPAHKAQGVVPAVHERAQQRHSQEQRPQHVAAAQQRLPAGPGLLRCGGVQQPLGPGGGDGVREDVAAAQRAGRPVLPQPPAAGEQGGARWQV